MDMKVTDKTGLQEVHTSEQPPKVNASRLARKISGLFRETMHRFEEPFNQEAKKLTEVEY